MTLRNFRQLFSVVMALLLGAVGLAAGLRIEKLPAIWIFPSFRELSEMYPGYHTFSIVALATLGVLLGTFLGPKLAQGIVNAGNAIERMSTRDKIAVGLGTFLGLATTGPFAVFLARAPLVGIPITILIAFAFVYLGIRAASSMKDELWIFGNRRPGELHDADAALENVKVLDTNVIIDGRVSDVCRSGFLDGTIYVPGFVLDELQHIADSPDSLKRARGRRGLDILNAMQKEFPLVVRSLDSRAGPNSQHEEVDARLVSLAKALGGKIVTNDFNLNKVAALQGVDVLNINELANSLKPVVLPGEDLNVTIIREGKEQSQGVAYLDDGTMIVIEDGRRHIGENLSVMVTSVLQTVAGKMIFARIKETSSDGEDGSDGWRGRAGSGPRKPLRQR